ncbi:MAG: YraN family protein [Amaricoccus sp.]
MSRRGHFSGLAGEEIAARLYEAEGGRVAATRWRCPAGEIDLIVAFPRLVVFVEVKARRDHAGAAGAVSAAQWRRLGAAAECWLAACADAPDCRFDLVLIDRAGRAERLCDARSFDAEF